MIIISFFGWLIVECLFHMPKDASCVYCLMRFSLPEDAFCSYFHRQYEVAERVRQRQRKIFLLPRICQP